MQCLLNLIRPPEASDDVASLPTTVIHRDQNLCEVMAEFLSSENFEREARLNREIVDIQKFLGKSGGTSGTAPVLGRQS